MLVTIDSYFFSSTPKYPIEIRKFLRAAFHDCMGGCDGSINIAKADNRGLEDYVSKMTQAFASVISSKTNPSTYALFIRMSRADFWVLCEERALGWGHQKWKHNYFHQKHSLCVWTYRSKGIQ